MTGRLILPAALAIALYLISIGGVFVQAQETTEVQGQVVNGTGGAELPDGLSVLMLITGADGRLAGTGQANSDGQGRFVFPKVENIDGGSYTVSVDHQGRLNHPGGEAGDGGCRRGQERSNGQCH